MKNEKELRMEVRSILLEIFEQEFDVVLREFNEANIEHSKKRREIMYRGLAGEDNPDTGSTQERG